jgi:hypothetical protein
MREIVDGAARLAHRRIRNAGRFIGSIPSRWTRSSTMGMTLMIIIMMVVVVVVVVVGVVDRQEQSGETLANSILGRLREFA